MDVPWEQLDMLGRLILAALVGGALGWEREWHHKPAGLRTHMLVSLGAAVFMVAALASARDAELAEGPRLDPLRLDPLRVVAGILGGVGFLGAGTIIRGRGGVEGITTAASIWLAAAIGTVTGMGYYLLTVAAGGLGLMILLFVGVAETKAQRRRRARKEAEEESD
jgi:putative Mg2+ transporter-C (MgtC) family protein